MSIHHHVDFYLYYYDCLKYTILKFVIRKSKKKLQIYEELSIMGNANHTSTGSSLEIQSNILPSCRVEQSTRLNVTKLKNNKPRQTTASLSHPEPDVLLVLKYLCKNSLKTNRTLAWAADKCFTQSKENIRLVMFQHKGVTNRDGQIMENRLCTADDFLCPKW